jgi:hypothetical protein
MHLLSLLILELDGVTKGLPNMRERNILSLVDRHQRRAIRATVICAYLREVEPNNKSHDSGTGHKTRVVLPPDILECSGRTLEEDDCGNEETRHRDSKAS